MHGPRTEEIRDNRIDTLKSYLRFRLTYELQGWVLTLISTHA